MPLTLASLLASKNGLAVVFASDSVRSGRQGQSRKSFMWPHGYCMQLARDSNTANFSNDVLSADQPVLVDFWASWCGPCRQMGPAVDQLADEFAGRAKVVKVNIDESPELATEYGVRSIPHFAVFENGEVTRQTGGSMPKEVLARLLEQPANA